jgi:hypothetical protein
VRLDSNALTRLQVRIEHSSIRKFRKHLASMIVALHQSSYPGERKSVDLLDDLLTGFAHASLCV